MRNLLQKRVEEHDMGRQERALAAHRAKKAAQAEASRRAAEAFENSPGVVQEKNHLRELINDWARRMSFKVSNIQIGYSKTIRDYDGGEHHYPHAYASFHADSDGLELDLQASSTASSIPEDFAPWHPDSPYSLKNEEDLGQMLEGFEHSKRWLLLSRRKREKYLAECRKKNIGPWQGNYGGPRSR